MLWHSAATCNVSIFPSLFCIFLRNYWSHLDQSFDFCSCCGIVQLIVKFQNFLSFLHFSQELLVWFWSNFDFCSCCGTLQPLAMFPNFLHFFAFFWRTTGLHQTLIFVHAVAFCSQLQSFTNFSVLALFSGTTGFIFINFDFCLCCFTLQPTCNVSQIFFTFLHFSQELLVWSSSNFDFRSCCGNLQPGAKFLSLLHCS